MKSPEMEAFLNKIAPHGYDNHQNHCSQCGKKQSEDGFRNKISRKEWNISKMCQKCQDRVFGED